MKLQERKTAEHFLNLIRKSKQGKFKLYIGMSAGVGKTYRMLQEAHALLKNGIDIRIGYIETHNRPETVELVHNIPIIPRRSVFYKGKKLEEMDTASIINTRPDIVIIDELAHSNINGSKNEKRWQDVLEILESGINVISALNIQHIESLNEDVFHITGINITERVPDRIIGMADEVVNIDLTTDDLIKRLKEGKIYTKDKIASALKHFFKNEHILQLRELALKEVSGHVVRKVDHEIQRSAALRQERFMLCISSNAKKAKILIRKVSRLASYYHGEWFVLYIQAAQENPDKISLEKQRMLINNFKLATELGAKVIQVQNDNIAKTIMEQAIKMNMTTICIGKPEMGLFRRLFFTRLNLYKLLKKIAIADIDLIILS